jgi:hypothetical protein
MADQMTNRNRKHASFKRELLLKSREAALCAIRVFNDPQVSFKSETYIVLMVVAWTYLLHAYYRSNRIEYRYFVQRPKRRVFDRTKLGAYKYWELERCINCDDCPVDAHTKTNLRFLIGIRHEIEHQMTQSLDSYLSGRYQACALNFNYYIKKLFGGQYGLDDQMAYCIQFLQLSEEQLSGPAPEASIPDRLKAYITVFDDTLTHDEYNSERYSFRLLFKRKMVNQPGQADQVVEFLDPKSDAAKAVDRQYWVKKEVERPKFLASHVAKEVQKSGFKKFRKQPEHVRMWKADDGKNPGKGFGAEVQGVWYWYQSWIDRCIELCGKEPEKYGKQAGK